MNSDQGRQPSAPQPTTVRAVLEAAFKHHREGRLQQAAPLYQAILDREPDHCQALHLLSLVLLHTGQAGRAVELLGRAIALNPGAAEYHRALAEAYKALGQLDRALNCCRLALQLKADDLDAVNLLGLIYLEQGNAAAIAQFREVLCQKPDFAAGHNNLGTALRLSGDKQQALEHFRRAVQLDPNLPEARSNLSQSLLEHGQAKEALEHSREAVRLRPNFAEAHNHLGNVLRALGEWVQARGCYAVALQLNPDLAMMYNNMGQALQDEGKLTDALIWFRQALTRAPASVVFHCNLANALAELGKTEEAVTHYQTVLRLDAKNVDAHFGLGKVYNDDSRLADARAFFQAALRLKPDFADAHVNLGNVVAELGDFDAALAAQREGLRHDPREGRAYAQMATLLLARMPDDDLAAMHRLLAEPDLPDAKAAPLHFALGQVLDARGDYGEAAVQFQQGNERHLAVLTKRGKVYDLDFHRRLIDRLIAEFTPDFFARVRTFGLETERPVFIVGLPRTGTTLAEQVLSSHSQVFGAGELGLVPNGFQSLPAVMGRKDSPLDCLADLDRATIQQVARKHEASLHALNATASRVVDKLPDNYLSLGLIATLFPKARLIHCRRDLRDTALSCWMTNFTRLNWTFDPDHIAFCFHEHRRLMDHWNQALPLPLLEVHYEEMVADLERVARQLVAWCGLEWEPACLDFHKNRRPVRTASVAQVRQPVYQSAVGRWKNYEKPLASLFAKL